MAADPSLVRHFVFGVLAAVAPPYSSAFASSLIRYGIAPSAVMGSLHTRRHMRALREYLLRSIHISSSHMYKGCQGRLPKALHLTRCTIADCSGLCTAVLAGACPFGLLSGLL